MNFRFFIEIFGPSDSKQQQNKNMKKIFQDWMSFFFAAAAPREKEKLNERKENKFYESFSIFLFRRVCAVKATLCTWQCLHTKKGQKTFDKTWMQKTFLIFLLFDCHVVASLSCLVLQSIFYCVGEWNESKRERKKEMHFTEHESWTLNFIWYKCRKKARNVCGCHWWYFISRACKVYI